MEVIIETMGGWGWGWGGGGGVGWGGGGGGGGGGGVTKVPFVNFSVKENFDLVKVHARFFKSHQHLTDVTAAELRRHLSI